MLAKGRLLGLQFETLFTDGLYYTISKHAAELAEQIRDELQSLGIEFLVDSPTNQQFPILPDALLTKLQEKYALEYHSRIDIVHSAVRICTCWATKKENVEALLRDIRAGL